MYKTTRSSRQIQVRGLMLSNGRIKVKLMGSPPFTAAVLAAYGTMISGTPRCRIFIYSRNRRWCTFCVESWVNGMKEMRSHELYNKYYT